MGTIIKIFKKSSIEIGILQEKLNLTGWNFMEWNYMQNMIEFFCDKITYHRSSSRIKFATLISNDLDLNFMQQKLKESTTQSYNFLPTYQNELKI